MYKMFYSGYTSVGSFYSGFYATSPDGLTWTKYNNTIPSTSDTTSTDGRIPKGNAGRLDSTGVLLTSGLLDNNVFKIWYSGYSGTNWRGAYATASNSYRALNLFVNSEGSVLFEGNSKFGKGTISTSNSIAVDEVSFSGTSIATEAVILSDVVNINTSTSTTGIFEIQNSGAVVNVDNVSESSTINIVSSSSTLNLNNSVNLNSVTGSGLELNLNDSSSVDSFNLVGNSTIKFNTDYYDGSSASTDGVLVINNRTFAGVIQSATTLLDSDDNEITEFEFRGTASNTSRGIDVPVSFYDSSTNSGTISADVTVNAPVTRPIGGTITGTVLYLGYDGFYYNNAAADGNWLNLSNWWSDSAHTTPATLPTQIDDVFVSGNISSFPNTGNALNTVSVAGTNGAWSLGTFSVSMWYNSKNSNWVQYMYSSGGVLYIQVRGQGSNPPYFRVYMGGSHTDFFAPSGIPNVVDKWTHVVFVRASDGKGYMYFNGQASPQNGANVGTTTLVPIAVLPRDSITDEFIVYDKALSQAEVNALYNNGAPVKITDLTNVYAYYSMDQSSGTTVTDNSGNGRNITFSSGYPSWQSGIVRKEDSTFPEVQSLNMSSGTNSTTIQTTLGATFSNTAAHNGTVFGSATFLEDDPTMSASAIASTDTTIKNRSLNFNGVNAFGTASNPGITGNTLTMSTWVKVDNYTGAAWKHIFGSNLAVPTSCPASPYTPYMFAAYSGSPGGVNFGVSTGADRTFVSVANTYIPLNQWTHLTGTYDGTTMKFYVNGVLRGSTPKTGNITAAPSGGLTFGSYPCASNRDWFTGGLSDTAIWNVALTQDQVTSLYNSAPDRIGVTPLSFWKFDAGSGSTAADSVGGRTVTLTSTQWQSSVPPIKYTDNATLTRIYTADATTTKDFTLNSGRWFIESDGADIDLSGATYAVSTTTYQSNKNVFRAKNGATFTENPSINGGAHVVPKVAVNSPVAGTNIRWNPDVDWDDADTCQYKWGANGTYANVSCAAGGSDIPRPTAFATTTLYVKGIYNDTSYSEQLSPSFVYDNVAPISTDCTFDMDESTRQYYYLESDVTGDCTATANITLKGASTTDATYTLNGQMIANATSTTAGFNLNLQNIIITGTTTANGGGNGNRGGSITVTDSTLANIVTNGGNISLTNVTTGSIDADGNTGLSTAATISITNSTTTDITANGGTGGSGVGGNGAAITITNSSVGLVDTNGGSSGKRGGAVTITDSTTSNITTNGGAISITNSVTSQLASNSNSGGILGGNITVDVSTTTAIYANGGNITISTSSVGLLDSTSPTAGIAGGDITVTNPVSEIPSITTNGGDVTLNNVVVVGSITANGNTGGVSAGAISISNSTTTAIYANGGTHASGNGGNGATITIATSTTGLIEASGADSTGDGGDGGIITITNSIGTSATSTPITANGGDSTSCGDGGDSGIVTIVDTTYGTITAEPGVGFNGGCPSDTKSSGIRNTVTTVGEGHSSIPRPSAPVTPSNPGAIGGGINPLFRNGLNGLDFTPIQQFNLFGDGSGGGFKPIDAGTTRLPKVFTDLNRLNDFLLDEMPVDILPSLELFVFDEVSGELADLFPNASNLLAAAGVERTQQLASLFRSPKLISDIENPEKYGLFKVYSGDVLVNTYVAYEQAVENLAQLIKANPSQIIHIGTYVKGKITDDSKIPYIVYQGQKKLMTPTFDGYYATSIIVPNLEGRYLIETSSSVQILLDVLPQNNTNEQSKPWGIFNRLWKLFH